MYRLRKVTSKIDLIYRKLTSGSRVLPDFLVAGTQKGGTTSLYNYLLQHPDVLPARQKEIHYFNTHRLQGKGPAWYRSNFPFEKEIEEGPGRRKITGEATPFMYSFHVPRAVSALVPEVKLVFLLRHPVDRAYSHYQHNSRREGREDLSFSQAIRKEEERIGEEARAVENDETYPDSANRMYSYVARGFYSVQLKRWMDHFPGEQIMIRKSEDLFNDPEKIVNEVTDYLQLPSFEYDLSRIENKGNYESGLNRSDVEFLNDRFKEEYQKIKDLTGIVFEPL